MRISGVGLQTSYIENQHLRYRYYSYSNSEVLSFFMPEGLFVETEITGDC